MDFNHISGETIHFSEATHRLQRWNVPTHVSDPDVPTRYAKYIKDIRYVTVPRKQLNQDFSTNMLLKIYLCIILMLTMAPNIPQCTLKMLVIQPGPPFHFNEVEMVKKRD